MNLLLVALGAAAGAPLRYLTDRWIQRRHDSGFPWGTFVVNTAGSLLLGMALAASPRHPGVVLAVGTGFCGALTTFSTFSFETIRLAEDGSPLHAVANVLASMAAGLAAATAGWALGTAALGLG